MPKLLIVVASTRPGRQGPAIAQWFQQHALANGQFDVEMVDLAELGLPLLDEPAHPRLKQYEQEHTRRWSAIVEGADAFVFVTPEYNFGSPPSLLNALDFLYQEWAYKPAGFVSYGGISGGLRSVQMTKLVLTALKVMPLPDGVIIPFFSKHIDDTSAFTPNDLHTASADTMLTELRRWSDALAVLR